MNLVRKLLALLALANIFLGVGLHARPPIALRNSAIGQGPAPNVTATDAFVNFIQEGFHATRVHTPQVWTGERLLIQNT